MTDLDQLDSIIQELESTSSGLKSIRSVYADLMEMGKSLENEYGQMRSANETLQAISTELRDENLRISTICNRIAQETAEQIGKNHIELTAKLEQNDAQLASRLERFQSDSIVEIRNGSDRVERALEVALERNIQRMEERYQAGIGKTAALVKQTTVGMIASMIVIGGIIVAMLVKLAP